VFGTRSALLGMECRDSEAVHREVELLLTPTCSLDLRKDLRELLSAISIDTKDDCRRDLEDTMSRSGKLIPNILPGFAVTLAYLCLTPAALAYIDLAPTLAKIVTDSKSIALVEVVEFDRTKHTVVLKSVRVLKGDAPAGPIQHDIAPAGGGVIPREIQQWAGPGARGVLFVSRNTALVCFGYGWYQAKASDAGPWKLGTNRPDLPLAYSALAQKLKSQDPAVRAEAAGDLRSLGRKAHGAAEPLVGLCDDKTPAVRLSAASALLAVGSGNPRVVEVLIAGLAGDAPAVRRDAAVACGMAGPGAAPTVEKLAGLLKDSDESVRVASLQAIATLGPVAAKAASAVVPLLDDPQLAVDAADARGRIGPAARPVPEQMVAMLSSEQAAVQRAALRAMAQIGGPEAHPAVDFILRAMPKASEIDAYNMAIYLALLGPEAADAIPSLQTMPVKNPFLSVIVRWAIESDKVLPWATIEDGMSGLGVWGTMMNGGGNGPGGGMSDVTVRGFYVAMIDELGERLRPAARLLARKIMNGTAGDVPDWGYLIFARAPDESIKILVPYLSNADIVLRERATVALAFMGPVASPARDQVAAAMDARKAPDEVVPSGDQ
jgi:hypothetical protein